MLISVLLTNAGTNAAVDEIQDETIELLSSLAGVAPPPADTPAGELK